MAQVDGWLRQKNLKGFVVALSELVGYRFDTLDWDAIETGLENQGDDGSRWFTYPLVGSSTLNVAISRESEEGDVLLNVTVPESDPCLEGKVQAAWMVFNRFNVSPDVELLD